MLGLVLQARAKARAAGQEFMDRSVLQGRFPMQLPPALLPRGQLTPPQQLVYEDFARIPRTAPGTAAFPLHAHRSSGVHCWYTNCVRCVLVKGALGLRPPHCEAHSNKEVLYFYH